MRVIINGVSHKGEGVAHANNKVVFIAGALPGEEVEIEITQRKSKFDRGKLLEITSPSPYRIKPPCPYYGKCGGCVWQHVAYNEQLRLKMQIFGEQMERIGGIENIQNIQTGLTPMDNAWNYRNKVTWHFLHTTNQAVLGYIDVENKSAMKIDRCLLIDEKLNDITTCLNNRNINPKNHSKDISVVLRKSSFDNKTMIAFQGQKPSAHEEYDDISSLSDSLFKVDSNGEHKLFGESYLHERLNNIDYHLSPLSFWQVNSQQNKALIEVVQKMLELSGTERILDAYCGVGSISLQLANRAAAVHGIESYSQAVANAKRNAELNKIKNCTFEADFCEVAINRDNKYYDIIILDPPRSGCDKRVIHAVTNKKPVKILYISCNPATLARDIKIFTSLGYETRKFHLIDMFPHTAHVETVLLLSRSRNIFSENLHPDPDH